MRALLLGAALLPLFVSATPAPVHAAPKAAAPQKPARATLSLAAVSGMLRSSEAEEVRSALEGAAQLPPRQVLPVLEERIRQGLPAVLLDVAIDTLQLLGDPASAPLLVDLGEHRRPEVRKRAIEALSQLRGESAERALTEALGDQHADVRAAAATGLGELGAADSFDALFAAQERGVPGSAAALGQIARPAQIERLLTLVGSAPLDVVAPLSEALFARKDLAEAEKLKLSQKLSELGTEEARALRDELLAKLPREASPRLRKALAAEAPKGAE